MKTTTHSDFPVKLRQLRSVCGYSQESVALAWSTSQAAISKLESGKSIITFERVKQAAYFYKLSVDELVNDDIHTLRIKAVDRQYIVTTKYISPKAE